MDKEKIAIARLQDAARLSEHRYKQPLLINYSGGKDSQVLLALAERAGINFEAVCSHTTADAPETVRFIRQQFHELEMRGGGAVGSSHHGIRGNQCPCGRSFHKK